MMYPCNMMSAPGHSAAVRCLLVRAGDHLCALPLNQVRRVLAALAPHPLPGAAPELLGLVEFAGEPLPVLDLRQLVGAPAGAAPDNPVTVVAWAGPPTDRELVGLAADAALSIVDLPLADVVGSPAGLVRGESLADGSVVRVLNLECLGGT